MDAAAVAVGGHVAVQGGLYKGYGAERIVRVDTTTIFICIVAHNLCVFEGDVGVCAVGANTATIAVATLGSLRAIAGNVHVFEGNGRSGLHVYATAALCVVAARNKACDVACCGDGPTTSLVETKRLVPRFRTTLNGKLGILSDLNRAAMIAAGASLSVYGPTLHLNGYVGAVGYLDGCVRPVVLHLNNNVAAVLCFFFDYSVGFVGSACLPANPIVS